MSWVLGRGRRQRRGHDWARWRAVGVFLTLFAIAGGVVWWTVSREPPFIAVAGGDCSLVRPKPVTERPAGPQPAHIHLTVLNGTAQRGLASQAATDLADRGFSIGRVGNAIKPLPGIALIRSGPRGVAEARVVARQLPGAKLVRDSRHGRSVDVVLGRRFHGLRHATVVPATATPTPCPSSSAVPSKALAR